MTPASMDVTGGQPSRATIEIVQPCADTEAAVTFVVSDPAHAVDLTVTGAPCVRAR